ncbi:DNA-directed RNA polymerase subunit H [archaeon]|jgi:DNA-directed RNA polymerase subunit H|nr:DNA-directed RNA polymerase subunit H [archaeon]MBT3451659.1 DNA-directed RNA polymerase subunit H [archaeon]MBT6869381.1 DNA-directed RNA polymerase subunit H [archaeon]MBT7192544.1 DNA-directed RNA polymerase subunit H [archaeon]MBT7380620.1 DNA-directed RNA polymerase subunit H [archaeon]
MALEGKHKLVPKHKILSDKEKEKVLNKYNLTAMELPKILKSDPALEELSPQVGDLVEITRDSSSAGTSIYYRVIING